MWTVSGVLTPDECADLIARTRSSEWYPATINTASGRAVAEHVRNNSTAIFDDDALAKRIYDKISPPDPLMEKHPAGIKPRWRIYRYDEGQYFGLHGDQSYLGDNGERSLLTLIVYLNDDYIGGETDFPELGERILPEPGKALLFQHMVLHEGCTVLRGTKYVLRSDVLYRSV